MIDVTKEKLMPLSDLARQLDVSYNTVNRMILFGRKNLQGEIVKMECLNTPSGRRTTIEAYYRFIGKLNEC